MADLLFSIVIPAYNAELYLRKCIDSCLNQKGDVPNYEIIIVNDGSTDGTQGIIDNYINANLNVNENDNNPKVSFIRQANGGLSKARNEGLKKAKGEYVWFVDSDDWIAEDSLSVMTDVITKHHPDVITFRGYDWKEGDLKIRKNPYTKDEVMSGMEVLTMMGTDKWNPCAQYYCMNKQFMDKNSLLFMDRVIHEDSEFTPRMLYVAKSVYVTMELLYYTYHNPVSLNRKKNPEKAFHTLRVLDSLCSFCCGIPNKKDRKIFNDIIATTMNMAMKETKDMDQESFDAFCKKLNKQTALCMIQSTKTKHMIEGLLLMIMPKLFIKYVMSHD